MDTFWHAEPAKALDAVSAPRPSRSWVAWIAAGAVLLVAGLYVSRRAPSVTADAGGGADSALPPTDNGESGDLAADGGAAAPRVVCSADAAAGALYGTGDDLPAFAVAAAVTTALPDTVSQTAEGSGTVAALTVSSSGALLYTVNGAHCWTSAAPRAFSATPAWQALLQGALERPVASWPHVAETDNGLRLHVLPLAISAPDGDERSRRVVWTPVSGIDATALCTSPSSVSGVGAAQCTLPPQPSAGGRIAAISPSRTTQLVLTDTGDLLTVSDSSFSTPARVVWSLYQAWCTTPPPA